MISNNAISRIAIVFSITGILLLAFQQQPKEKTIMQALAEKNNYQIEIKGTVSFARQNGNNYFFEINDGNRIKAVFSGSKEEKELIKPGSKIKLSGKISIKNNEKTFFASEVKKID